MADYEECLTRDELIALAKRRYRMLEDAQMDLRRLQDAVAAELAWPVWQRDWAPLRKLVAGD